LIQRIVDQNVVFGIMIIGWWVGSIHDSTLCQKVDVRSHVMKEKFLLYKLMGNVVSPMWPWFHSPFKGEKDGWPRYKTHWNFIQYDTRMLVEKTFGMLKLDLKL
jgi:hypothetical protein